MLIAHTIRRLTNCTEVPSGAVQFHWGLLGFDFLAQKFIFKRA